MEQQANSRANGITGLHVEGREQDKKGMKLNAQVRKIKCCDTI